MADISRYLQDILSAVYGEEVRGSIHDAIEIINDVSEAVLTTGTAVTGPTSSSEGFFEDSLYLNTNTFELWKCVGVNTWQSQGVTKGADGNGIFSIQKTGTAGLVDTYTITYTNGTTSTFEVTNGADGADGADGSTWYKGTALSGTGTAITGFPGKLNDFYLNSTSGNVYICTKAGGTLPPDAAEWEYVMTLTGGGGGTITVIDHLNSTSSTDALSANQGRVLDGKKQEKFASYSDGLKEEMVGPVGSQTLQLSLDLLAGSNITLEHKNGAIEINSTGGGGGGGLLPYFYIDSEAGATVTVTAPDGSTITPTAAGSGHWECEVPMYGVYTVHSVLAGQGDATINVTVDDVKEYHITDNHFDYTINVIAPSGSTIRITGGGETYTGTGTGSSQAFAVHQASTQYTVAVTMDGNTKSETVTSAATTGQSTTVSIAFGTITVNVAQDFITAGSTITCTKGGTSCTGKVAASTVTFRVPETGTWEIAGTIGADTYTVDAVVSSLSTAVTVSLETLPDGKTVTPTDDIQIWLACAGITNLSYTTLDEVLADHDTLARLISHENAVDYMVRSKKFINVGLVPIMTSNTTPNTVGECVAESEFSGTPAWYAFDGTDNFYIPERNHSNSSWYLGYKFNTPTVIQKAVISGQSANASYYYKLAVYGGNDISNLASFTKLSEDFNLQSASIISGELKFNNTTAYTYYVLMVTDTNASYTHVANTYAIEISKLQFYTLNADHGITEDETAMRYIGKRNYASDTLLDDADWCEAICDSEYYESILNYQNPFMTSDTTPSGVASASSSYDSRFPAWKGFDGDTSGGTDSYWHPTSADTALWLQYDFGSAKKISAMRISNGIAGGTKDYEILASNDDFVSDSHVLASGTFPPNGTGNPQDLGGPYETVVLNNGGNSYRYYRVHSISTYSAYGRTAIYDVRFCGREDVVETNIDIYSAANDTVSISGNGVSLTCVTDASGHGTIAKSSLPAGTYTFTSSVALDPDNLDGSHYYSKQMTINDGTIEVWVMPDNVLYWFGCIINLEQASPANGWTCLSSNTYIDSTFATNYIEGYNGSRCTQIGNKRPILDVTKYHLLFEVKADPSSANHFGLLDSKSQNNWSGYIASAMSATAITHYQGNATNPYCMVFASGGSYGRTYAIWYE